ncbi:MAG: DHA2 family efflux MFS transporter permease subunit [Rhabdochlamydiaceae bacterium]|nr:DHA2 family efflux MFS transporter permease subunit [Candidatus Amphrikana amoebophyrae]
MSDKQISVFQWRHPQLIESGGDTYPWIVLCVISLLLVLGMFSVVSTSVADSVIRGHFSLSESVNTWVNTTTLLTLVAVVPLSEFFAQRLGYKMILFLGASLFTLGLLISGLSVNIGMLIGSRVVTGLGMGLYMPISIGILAMAFPSRKLPIAFALYSAIGFGGGLAGAFYFGGLFAQYYSWHWVFFASVFVGIICILVILLVLQETESTGKKKFDTWGYICYVCWICSILVIVASAKSPWNTEGWSSPFMKTFYTIGATSFILFTIIELRTETPLFDIRLFKIRAFILGNILLFLVGAVYFATAQLMPSMLQKLLHYSKYKSGIYMIPHGVFLGLSSAVIGLFSKQAGIRIPVLAGCVILAISCFMQYYFSVYSDHKYVVGLLVFRGLGVGLSIGPVTALALRRVPKEHMPNASMIITLSRQLGAAIATSVLEIFQVQRGTFHRARFFEQLGRKTPEYLETVNRLQNHMVTKYGLSQDVAQSEAKGAVVQLVSNQAALAGINDGYIVFGIALSVLTIIVASVMIIAKLKGEVVDTHYISERDKKQMKVLSKNKFD